MTKKFLPVLLCLLLPACTALYSRQPEWIEYSLANGVLGIAEEEDRLWLATWSGLVQFNRKTSESIQYTLLNTGLPAITISHVAVDGNGVRWMATGGGLVRFDGTEWTVYDTTTSPLSSQSIEALSLGPDNTVWIATRNELASLHNGTWKIYDYKQYPCIERTTSIYAGESGALWLGKTSGNESCLNVYRWENGVLQPVHDSLAIRATTDITYGLGRFWFATYRGEPTSPSTFGYPGTLLSYNGSDIEMHTWESIGFSKALPFHGVSVDSAGGVWVITDIAEGGAARFDGSTWTVYSGTGLPVSPTERLNSIITDSDGIVWIGTHGSGLLRFNGSRWEHIPSFGLGFPPIGSIAIDRDQSIWSTHWHTQERYNYCTRFNGGDIRTIPTPADIRQIMIAADGTKWLVSWDNRLLYSTGNSWTEMETEFLVFRMLYIDRSNHLWIKTTDNTIAKFNGSSWEYFSDTAPEKFGSCSAITQDGNGILWFGTTTGLWAQAHDLWHHYPRSWEELPDGGVGTLVIACDSANNIWLGSNGLAMITRGLDRFDGIRWQRFHGADTLRPITYVSSIAVDRTGNVWVGGNYLQKFDGKVWSQFSPANSPVALSPHYLIMDSTNTLWMYNQVGILGYREDGIVVSAPESPVAQHNTLLLHNYPNPASTLTTFSYSVPEGAAQRVHLKVHNALGAVVATVVDRVQAPGDYSVGFDTGALPAGVYYYHLQTGNTVTSRQMVVVR